MQVAAEVNAWVTLSLGLIVLLASNQAGAQAAPPSGQRDDRLEEQAEALLTEPVGPFAGAPVVDTQGRPVVRPRQAAHPILPQPSKPPRRAYQLYWEIDVPVLALATSVAAGRLFRTQSGAAPAYCTTQPQGCDKNELNMLDRPFAGRWDPAWATYSDVGAWTLGLAPVLLLPPDGGVVNALNDAVVIYQSAMVAIALSGLATIGTARPRPFLYGDEAPLEQRNSAEGALSYISGHATFSFAMATSTFWTVQRRQDEPGGVYPWIVLGTGMGLASSVAAARVAAGRHFPTDVLAGAAVGASVGTLVPFLHAQPVQVTAGASGASGSIQAMGWF